MTPPPVLTRRADNPYLYGEDFPEIVEREKKQHEAKKDKKDKKA